MKELEDILLETLSFYEPMRKEQILMDMDESKIQMFPDLSIDDLEATLKKMRRKGLLKSQGDGVDRTWLRINAKRGLWFKLKSLIFRG